MSFPDYHHLRHLARALWADGLTGQAAAMVGAGFSFNAVPTTSTRRVFPSWSTLVGRMIDELYPLAGSATEARRRVDAQAQSVSGALRLAQEYCVSFGRAALDDLLLDAIPDDVYGPGVLHKALLALPWSDVLTTNYDTLLERGAAQIPDYTYATVQTPEDLTTARRPRIIKLHGSFPSVRPFIVAEEDFRTYSRAFPAYVNAAQQVFIENVVCLIGFSGDDPNFLQWSGWVRDSLGASIRRIYLLGVLQLAPTQRMVLESRNVVPIDLAPLFPENMWPDRAIRHSRAHEWAFQELLSFRPINPLNWPIRTRSPTPVPSAGLPPIANPQLADLKEERRSP